MICAEDDPTYSGSTALFFFKCLKPDCSKCFGLCCTALNFSKQDGFPTDKNAGTPCPNLTEDFRCCVHEKLGKLRLKGMYTVFCLPC